MAFGAGSGRAHLARFTLAVAVRRVRYAFHSSIFYRWRFAGPIPDRLLIAPTDLRTSDPTIAHDIYAGRFVFAGEVVDVSGFSVFEIEAPSPAWAARLHGFGWLRHLRASDLAVSRSNARALVDEWIRFQKSHDPAARDPDVTARRILSWLAQTPLVLEGCDHGFYRRFMRSLTKQVRHLRRVKYDVTPGLPRLRVMIALAAAGLSLSDQPRLVRQATRWLDAELQLQILADGGHVSRNPGTILEILVDLLPLRQAFTARGQQPSPVLLGAIDRMMPMLRFFRHSDGSFGKFNGMGDTQLGLLATVLAYDDARGAPVRNAPFAGYQRLESSDTVVLVDTGPPPATVLSAEAHAGCLSFEMSVARQLIIVNCGVPGPGMDDLRRLSRTTAAHSTVTLNDSSSCRFLTGGSLARRLGEVVIAGPQRVESSRQEERGVSVVTAAHDGYVSRFGIRHERRLSLAMYGDRLEGFDSFTSPSGGTIARGGRDSFALRFHLHPAIQANRIKNGRSVLMVLPDGSAWEFQVQVLEATIEESIRLSDIRGSRRAEQIVVYGRALHQAAVRWRISRVSEAGGRLVSIEDSGDDLPPNG